MFCPNCGYEYRNEFSMCPDCQVSLEENIPDEKKHYNKNKIRLYKLNNVLKNTIKKALNSNFYNKLSLICYKLLIISLFLYSYFTLRYNSLLLIGPGWEIPVDLVKPIKFSANCAQLSFLLCIAFFIIAFKRVNEQKYIAKFILILWFIGNIILYIYFLQDVPENYVILIIKNWWVGLILPGILVPTLIFNDTSKKDGLKKHKYLAYLFNNVQNFQRGSRTNRIIEYIKKDYKKVLNFLLIMIACIAYHPKVSENFWDYLFGIQKSELIFIIDIFINFIVIISILCFESKFKLKYRFERVTRNIPEHRMGTVTFVLFLLSLAVLFLIIYFGGYLTNEFVLAYLLAYVGYAIPYYTLHIVRG
ncbi:TFIIB-type zinc ribbon-containing protein [Ruminiclostridium papyrosolvens]|uniref:Uncharacterized protein n=1 Tax=Ruminiclostridium papyrosolvens C7 TaxID=1330534 RepID=U4R5Z6_9FIRM|nr:TFIIB-type zinc ribbon-containing protein [Ruminiclostridium papyrosolvens]EPR13865.1 hypothetical protein L323_02565 [Ruminiclostridium papyrosolvens C7]